MYVFTTQLRKTRINSSEYYYMYVRDCMLSVVHTVPPESINPLGHGNTSSLLKGSAENSLRWDENLKLILALLDT